MSTTNQVRSSWAAPLAEEGAKPFLAFYQYLTLPPETRSLAEVGRKLGKSKALIERWSAKWRWVDRARDFDAHISQRAAAAQADRRIALALAREEWEAEQHREYRAVVKSLIEEFQAARKLPRTDATSEKFDAEGNVIQRSRVRGVRIGEIKALIEALIEADRVATHGHPRTSKTMRLEPAEQDGSVHVDHDVFAGENPIRIELELKPYDE